MTEARNPLATMLGTYYPTHYVVAAFPDPARAGQALAALREAGFQEAAAALCPGPDFLRNYRDFVAHRGPLQRAEGRFPSEERAAAEEYLAAAERGASFVTVHAPRPAERERAREVLRAAGGEALRYYGDHTITDLP